MKKEMGNQIPEGKLRRLNLFIMSWENALSKVGACGMAGLFLLILASVISREIHMPILFGDEMGGYLMVLIVFLMGSETLRLGMFIRVDFVTNRLSDRRRKQVLFVSDFLTLLLMAVMTYYSWKMLIDSYQTGLHDQASLETPIYLTQISVVVGFTLVLVRLFIGAYNDLITLRKHPG